MKLIDKEQLIEDFYSSYVDLDEFKRNLISTYVNKEGYIYEDDVIELLNDFLEGIVNIIETAEIYEKKF